MLKKTLKIAGVVIGVIVFVVAAFYLKVYISTEMRINRKYTVMPEEVNIATDSVAQLKEKF